MNHRLVKTTCFLIGGMLLLAPVNAAPIACATGDLAKYGTTVKSIPGVPDQGVTSSGGINEGVDAVNMISLADIKRNQMMMNSDLERTSGKIKLYCSSGIMGNESDCSYAKKEFLDAFAWAYNSKTPIDCKYTKMVSEKTQNAVMANPIKFLKKSRFDCGSNNKQLCCADCIKTGFVSESAGW
jgi:hypothetical protein